MDKLLKAHCKQNISFAALTSRDGAGDPTYAASQTLKGYLTGKITVLINAAGIQRTSNEVIYFDEITGALIEVDDKLTTPDGREHIVRDIKPYYNRKGVLDYVEVFL